jgi:AcrR family transcriptional regulator
VVDALLDLYQEGVISPGAQDIADRSGVSRRSVFRYFDDMDDLDRVAIERHEARIIHLFEIDGLGEGPLAERIERLCRQRIRLFDQIAPVRRIAVRRAPKSPLIAQELERSHTHLRAQLVSHFAPEFGALDASTKRETIAAATVLTSFEAFEAMHREQKLTLEETAATMRRGLAALLGR